MPDDALTTSVDHRASDGVEAARFMQEMKGLLERPVAHCSEEAFALERHCAVADK